MNKKGISLVALVITIIVLIILTGAVIMTGLNAPSNASEAVANYNTTVVQDAVTIYVMNYVVSDTSKTVMDAVNSLIATGDAFTSTESTDTPNIAATAATLGLNMTDADLQTYKISVSGMVSK